MTSAVRWPDAPRAHRDKNVVAGKLARLREPHVAPLNEFVEEINQQRGDPEAAPWFDPDGGGIHARVLFLLENPGPRSTAARGSGIISADNDDNTAANFFQIREEVGLPRDQLVAWNIVPWYQADGHRTANATRRDVDEARPWLKRLLEFLPEVELVVTMGVPARDGWLRTLAVDRDVPLLPTLALPHCSPRNLAGRPHERQVIIAGMRRVAILVSSSSG